MITVLSRNRQVKTARSKPNVKVYDDLVNLVTSSDQHNSIVDLCGNNDQIKYKKKKQTSFAFFF